MCKHDDAEVFQVVLGDNSIKIYMDIEQVYRNKKHVQYNIDNFTGY